MVLNRSEEEGSHCIVIPLGKLIELPVRTSEILPPSSRLGGWGGHSDYVETNMFTLALHLFHDFAILNSECVNSEKRSYCGHYIHVIRVLMSIY